MAFDSKPTSALSEAELRGLSTEILDSTFQIDPEALTLVGRHSIRTGSLYRCSVAGMDIAVKVARNWSSSDVRRVFEESRRLESVLSEVKGVRAPAAMGWTETPPTVWAEYVRGSDVKFLLSDPAVLDEDRRREFIDVAVRRMAEGLAAYHRDRTGLSGPADDSHRSQLTRRARILMIDPTPLASVGPSLQVVRLYHDYSPANLRVGEDGEIFVLDPPAEPIAGFPHKDLARFTRGIGRCLSSPAWSGKETEAGAIALSLSQTFLTAYEEVTGIRMRTGEHQWLMMLFEILRQWRRVGSKFMDMKVGALGSELERARDMRRRLRSAADDSFLRYVRDEVLSGDPDRLR